MSRVLRDFNPMKVTICFEAVTVCSFKATKHDCIDLLRKFRNVFSIEVQANNFSLRQVKSWLILKGRKPEQKSY